MYIPLQYLVLCQELPIRGREKLFYGLPSQALLVDEFTSLVAFTISKFDTHIFIADRSVGHTFAFSPA
jgi:hypothetical protein